MVFAVVCRHDGDVCGVCHVFRHDGGMCGVSCRVQT